MTTKDWKKAFKQLKAKPAKMAKYIKHNAPKQRKTGKAKVFCSRCGNTTGHNSQYGMSLCRCCFRDIASKIGFRKYS